MTDAEEQIQDIAEELNLPPAVVMGISCELAKNPDRAQLLELCDKWGIGWPHLTRLEEMRPRNMEAIGKGLAQQAAMLSNKAQEILAKKLNTPAEVANMTPKDAASIAKQMSDVALGWSKEAPVQMGGGNTFNIVGGTIQEILSLKAMKENEKPALARLIEKGVTIPTEA
jgi:hypothetical protein